MRSYGTFLWKEWTEVTRNFKLLWIPLVFLLFGFSEPLTSYYLPDILEKFGNLPEGTVIPIPHIDPAEVIAATVSQYEFIGMIVLVAAFSGTISKERQNGTATLIYARPISFTSYYLAKWTVGVIVTFLGVVPGLFISWWYTGMLFEYVEIEKFFSFVGIYLVWWLFVLTVIVTLSAWFRSALATVLSFAVVILIPIILSFVGNYWPMHPWKLTSYAIAWMRDGVDSNDIWITIGLTVMISLFLLWLGIIGAKVNTKKAKIS
ncbi:ABC transporter permease [Paenisporosarcina cavernae]|uniref:ABC transporter permease n=1 Tax=Paenisporosarcina cavernae TaxID=2320858 RepID=A0A385YXL4_9BACL|nr:ABC transporter permease subunit [Paenisporosarcina cavernae]AYC30657.1 ABC transporter permease [Paenisporosarcina cavernae]